MFETTVDAAARKLPFQSLVLVRPMSTHSHLPTCNLDHHKIITGHHPRATSKQRKSIENLRAEPRGLSGRGNRGAVSVSGNDDVGRGVVQERHGAASLGMWEISERLGEFKVVRSHSLGKFWKSARHKSMSAKAPRGRLRGKNGQR